MSEPNYRRIEPDPDKDKEDYTYVERRAHIYNLIEQAGHYRNIEQTQRELAADFDVSQTTIWKDIDAVNEWMADNLGENAEEELTSLKNAAVQDLINQGEFAQAYRLISEHYELLQRMGIKDKEPDEVEMSWREYAQMSDED